MIKDKLTKTSTSGKIASALLIVTLLANILGLAISQEAQPAAEDLSAPYVVEECIDMPPSIDEIILEDDKEKQSKAKRISFGSFLYFISMWLIDTLSNLLPALFSAILTPLGVRCLGWLLFAAGIVLSICKALKKAFPGTPLKEMLSKKRLFIILLFIALIVAACEIALHYLKKFVFAVKLVALEFGLILIICSCKNIIRNY